MSEDYRYGVLLVNTGTPDEPTPQAVKEYLAQFLMDDRIVPMNRALWWMILHCCILPKRKVASAEKYKMIWTSEGSTFKITHASIERKLNAYFKAQGNNALVACAMSYGHPSVYQELERLQQANVSELIVLPLYPQSAYSTTGSVKDSVEHGLKRLNWDISCSVIDNYADNASYIGAMVDNIKASGFGQESTDRILFSFHSIPLVDIEHGDTYNEQIKVSCELLACALGLTPDQWSISYQCQFDKGREWLHPFTQEILRDIAQEPKGRVFMVCPNFVADCLETLYDVNYEFKPMFEQALYEAGHAGEGELIYVPCLNDSDDNIKVFANVIAQHFSAAR